MLPILGNYSSVTNLKRVTAWVLRLVDNCKLHQIPSSTLRQGALTVEKLLEVEKYWLKVAQSESVLEEITALKSDAEVPRSGCLSSLLPFLDSHGILWLGGRGAQLKLAYGTCHPRPFVLPSKYTVTKLHVCTEHLCLLHVCAWPTLVVTSPHCPFQIIWLGMMHLAGSLPQIGSTAMICANVQECVICRHTSAKPWPQMLGQLPVNWLNPGPVFQQPRSDYAGSILIKRDSTCKPTLVKAYVRIFVSLSVKAAFTSSSCQI